MLKSLKEVSEESGPGVVVNAKPHTPPPHFRQHLGLTNSPRRRSEFTPIVCVPLPVSSLPNIRLGVTTYLKYVSRVSMTIQNFYR